MEEERVLFWRTTVAVESFADAYSEAEVELIEFASEDAFQSTTDIYEVPSRCICYNPECSARRYKDDAGRVYARCLPEDVGGDIAEQIQYFNREKRIALLSDIEKYLREEGYYTSTGAQITFSCAPGWWVEKCARCIADCFSEDD